MWALLQVVGCIFLSTALVYMRKNGLCINTWLFYVFVNVAITSWAFPIAYKNAPSFFQVYFLGTTLLTFFGFIGSVVYFKESITILKCLGVLLTFCGVFLLL